jgi:hypothetical protein
MTPLTIDTTVSSLSNAELGEKLHFLSYTFCVNADFSKTEATAKLIDDLEVCMMEGLLRILEAKFGYKPFQNRIYEKVEKTFKNQDVYNINRMMSSLRRTKLVPLDAENDKYINWMSNRVKYGVKSVIDHLNSLSTNEVTALENAYENA